MEIPFRLEGHTATRFQTTQWSVVLAAGRASTPDSREALSRLCEDYWRPLFGYALRKGHGSEAARDLTQGFFASLIEKGYVQAADPSRGRFRAFLLTAFKNFMANERDRELALKRGGGMMFVDLDTEGLDLREDLTPERAYERQWALALLDASLARLRGEVASERFDIMKEFLTADSDSYAEAAGRLGLSEGAVRVAVHRMRKRFRELVREEILRLVEDPSEVDDELRTMFAALAG